MKRFSVRLYLTLAALLALSALERQACADILGFGNFAGFTLNKSDAAAAPIVSPGQIRITSQSFQQGRSIFFNTPQPISAFTASFTYRAVNAGNASVSIGATFVLQDSAAGPSAIGGVGTGGGLAYQGIGSSAAASIELSSLAVSRSGLFTGGVVGGGSGSISPVNLFSGNPISVTLSYDGSMLRTRFFDTTTAGVFETAYLANLPSIVGNSNAYVGFTASTGFGTSAEQYLSDFQFVAVPEPAGALLLAVGGGALAAGLRARKRGPKRD